MTHSPLVYAYQRSSRAESSLKLSFGFSDCQISALLELGPSKTPVLTFVGNLYPMQACDKYF